jgi:peptidoglycan/LPS O-acetylase OafA/YrhL
VIFALANAGLLGLALWQAPRLRLPALGFVGAISYSWYLYHGGIGFPLMIGLESHWAMSPLLSTAIAFGVTFLVAWLSYRVIEQPGIHLGRIVEQRVVNAKSRTTLKES